MRTAAVQLGGALRRAAARMAEHRHDLLVLVRGVAVQVGDDEIAVRHDGHVAVTVDIRSHLALWEGSKWLPSTHRFLFEPLTCCGVDQVKP